MSKTLIKGYKKASEKTGLTVWQLIRMVESRKIRVIKPNEKSVMFYLEDLLEDLEDMTVPKIS